MVKKQHTSNPCPGAETEEQQCVSGSCTTPQLARQHCVIQICHQSSMRSLPPSLEHFCPLFMIFEAICPDGVSFGLDRVSFFQNPNPISYSFYFTDTPFSRICICTTKTSTNPKTTLFTGYLGQRTADLFFNRQLAVLHLLDCTVT